MQSLHILDGHGYIFRAHFGLMTSAKGDRREIRLSNKDGMPTGALYVFTRMLLRLAADAHPSHRVVVFDAGRKSFRTELYPEYKAHRPPTPEDLAIQLPYFRQITEALGWPVLSIAGVEADDVIATLVTQARAPGRSEQGPAATPMDVTIVSADKDLMQLVGDGVAMYDSMAQKTYHRDEVIAKFGVPPERVHDYLALVGDASDNVPGVSGVGDKTAVKLLTEYPSLDAMIAANPVVPRLKVKQPFGDSDILAKLAISRQLVALDRSVPLPLGLADLVCAEPKIEALRALFEELDFGVLLQKFPAVAGGAATVAAVPGAGVGTAAEPVNQAVRASASDALAAGAATHNGRGRGNRGAKAAPVPRATAPATVAGQGAFDFSRGALGAGDASPSTHEAADLPTSAAGPTYAEVPVVTTASALAELVQAMAAAGQFALTGQLDGARDDRALACGIALVSDRHAGYIPLIEVRDGQEVPTAAMHDAGLRALLANPAIGKTGVGAKSLQKALARQGLPVAGVTHDAQIAAFVDDPTRNAAELSDFCLHAQVAPVAQLALAKHQRVASLPATVVAATVGGLAQRAGAAVQHLQARWPADALALYRDVEIPVANLLVEVEANGICIDAAYFAELSREVAAQVAVLEAQIFAAAGAPFVVGSPKQLGAVLFEKLGLTSERMKKNKTGYSTDHDVLEAMIEAHPIVGWVLQHRELTKLANTYLDALPPLVSPLTQRLHTTYNMVVAATGRLSSQDPNLQNIPIRTELGKKIRRGFVAAPGHVLISADYSQIELRILAHLSQDPVLCHAFATGQDVHTQTASEVFGLPVAEVTSQHRRIAKAVNYGLIYGQSDFGLARALDIPRREAAEYSTRYFEKFPAIRQYLRDVVAQAKAAGGTTTMFGRWRPIADLDSKTQVARRAAERIAQNTPMQGAGADIMKIAMLRAVAALRAAQLPVQLLLTVHDELVFEAPPDLAALAAPVIVKAMSEAATLSVPLDVDVGIATNWADC